MILSDKTIKFLCDNAELVTNIKDMDVAIQPASIDCILGRHFKYIDYLSNEITMDSKIEYREKESDSIVIPPKTFVLGTTEEYFNIPDNMAAVVQGRSSIGRMGLFVENAAWIDPGFKGKITLELYNANQLPIKLEAGRRICQVVFYYLDHKCKNPYRGKYQGQNTTIGSLISKDSKTSQ